MARAYGSAHRHTDSDIGAGHKMIDQQLEQDFSALRGKVRELQEYL